MTKERMKDLLIIGMLPFLVVAYETTDWSFMKLSEPRQCAIIHENMLGDLKCERYIELSPHFMD